MLPCVNAFISLNKSNQNNMRKIAMLLLLATPFFTSGQNKNVANATRVFPKTGHWMAFEKALGAHVGKYHKGDFAWRVFTIETGPDVGGYHIVEGPSNWTAFDSRGDLGAEHTADWETNVVPHLTDRSSNSFSVYIDSLSTAPLKNYTDKIIITHVYPKMGYGGEYMEHLKKIKNAWAAGNQSVAVYQSAASGKPGYALVYRLKDGLKELEDNYRKSFRERYEAANGAGTFSSIYLQNQRTIIKDESWSEILYFKPKLSTPAK